MNVVTRSDAIARLKTRYFTGKPCAKGHIAQRSVSNQDCIECARLKRAAWAKTPEGKAKRAITNKRWYEGNLEYAREANRKASWRRDGMPAPTRTRPLKCECCGGNQQKRAGVLSLDHCHVTGAFRGWLCDNCNRGIGFLGDNLEGVMRAVEYLRTCECGVTHDRDVNAARNILAAGLRYQPPSAGTSGNTHGYRAQGREKP